MHQQSEGMKVKLLKRENDLILEQLLKEGDEVERLQTEIKKLHAENQHIREALKKMEDKARFAERTLAGIRRSFSWRLTAPLRAIRKALGRR